MVPKTLPPVLLAGVPGLMPVPRRGGGEAGVPNRGTDGNPPQRPTATEKADA